MRFKKLNAGALQLVTYITVVIALLLGCFILLLHTQKQFRAASYTLTETIQNTDKGILYAITENSIATDSIYLNTEETVALKTDFWGAFKKVGVTSTYKNNTFKKTALIGTKQPSELNALYLKNHNKPLVLVGNTLLKGNVYLPEQGIKSGNISGQSYYREKFVDGNLKQIGKFPKLNFQVRNHLQNIHTYYDSQKYIRTIMLKPDRSVSNSFTEPVQLYTDSNDIYLNAVSIKGNIVIQSYSKISISHTAVLKDIILIAPKIEIGNNVKGTFQAFATEYIQVGNGCNLAYPSVLGLIKNYAEPFTDKNEIKLGINSSLQGSIIMLGKKDSKNYNPQLVIDTNTIVEGEIYSELLMELKGKVHGTIFTDGFVTRANGSYYQNHLLNAEINRNKLNNEYVGLPIIDLEKGVAKWLY